MAHSEYQYIMPGGKQKESTNTFHATRMQSHIGLHFTPIRRETPIVLTKTIIKSRIVQKLVKYLQKPKASHFRSISTLKSAQKPRLVQ